MQTEEDLCMHGVSPVREEQAVRMYSALIPIKHDVPTRDTRLLVLRAVDDVDAADDAPRRNHVREHAERRCSCLTLAVERRVDEQCCKLFVCADGARTICDRPQRDYRRPRSPYLRKHMLPYIAILLYVRSLVQLIVFSRRSLFVDSMRGAELLTHEHLFQA